MAKNIATLSAVLTANTGQFNSAMAAAVRPVNVLGNAVSAITHKLASFQNMLIGGAGIAGIGYFFKKTIEAAASLEEVGKQTGIATDKLAGLRYAADMSGSSAEKMDIALRRMDANLADAALDGGTAAKALRRIGLDAKELTAIAPDQAFYKIADAIKAVESPTLKAHAAMGIFGKGGVDVLSVLDEGAAGLKKWQDEAVTLKIALDDFWVGVFHNADKAMTRFSKSIVGLGYDIGVELAPWITLIANKMTEFVTSLDIGDAVQSGLGALANLLPTIGGMLGKIADMITNTFAPFDAGGAIYELLNVFERIRLMTFVAQAGVGKQFAPGQIPGSVDKESREKSWANIGEEIKKEGLAAASIMNLMHDLSTSFVVPGIGSIPRNMLKRSRSGGLGGMEAAEAAEKRRQTYLESMQKRGHSLTESLRTPGEVYRDNVIDMERLYNQGLLSYETYTRGMKKETDALEKSLVALAEKQKEVLFKAPQALVKGSSGEISARVEMSMKAKQGDNQISLLKQQAQSAREMVARLIAIERLMMVNRTVMGMY